MDRYTQFGLRGEADETLRRAVRDGFKRAGLGHAQLTQAMEWYRDHVLPGVGGANLGETFNDFARLKGWTPEQLTAAVGVYSQIRDQGPAAVLATPSPEDDAALIAKVDELLKTNADAYFRDQELQELALEARERQLAAPPAEPAVDDYAIERRIAQQDVDRFAAMLRDPAEAAKYWASPDLQRRHHDAIAASIKAEHRGTAPAASAEASPAVAAPSVPAAAPMVLGEGGPVLRSRRPEGSDRNTDARGWRQSLLGRCGRAVGIRSGARALGGPTGRGRATERRRAAPG